MLPLLFAISLFLSAALLFAIQLMMGKAALPKFGGGPAVWNTCMVFYQGVLLAGYAYAHFAPQRLGGGRQRRLHLVLLLLPLAIVPLGWVIWPFAAMPLGLAESWAPPASAFPPPYVLFVLLAMVGLPFFVLSTSAPLLQRWYASTGRAGAGDPYFLYAASNLGSLAALLSYPFLVERYLSLTVQGWLWLVGYILFAGLIALCMKLSAPASEEGPPAAPDSNLPNDTMASQGRQLPEENPNTEDAAAFPVPEEQTISPGADAPGSPLPTPAQRFLWVARAFVPSSLMLGLTTHFTTEIAPVPLLWVLPLAAYLVSFIIAFGRTPVGVLRLFAFLMPPAILLLAYLLLTETKQNSMEHTFALHLGVLFIIATGLHGAIAEDRPQPRHLTEFFLWIALGGVLGGGFNAWAAPYLFFGIAEYPLALVLAALLLPPLTRQPPLDWRGAADLPLLIILGLLGPALLYRCLGDDLAASHWLKTHAVALTAAGACYLVVGVVAAARAGRDRLRRAADWLMPLVLLIWTMTLGLGQSEQILVAPVAQLATMALATLVFVLAATAGLLGWQRCWAQLLELVWPALGAVWLIHSLNLLGTPRVADHEKLYLYGLPLVLAAAALDRPLRFGLGVAAIFLVGGLAFEIRSQGAILYRERSFFGPCRVVLADDAGIPIHCLVHGSIMHGLQPTDPSLRQEPTSYYHPSGPIGDLMLSLERRKETAPIAVLGLGAGSMASWARPGQEMVFFEIDPAVVRIAEDARLFTYLADARERGVQLRTELGDGRVRLGQEADGHFGVILADAFSSDAIPTHLMTREALAGFLRKLAPGGVIGFNISNRYLDMRPVLGNLAHDAGLVAYRRFDMSAAALKTPADWVLLARRPEDLAGVINLDGWERLSPDLTRRLWTDDYSNLLDVYRWQK